ncbi:LysM peptidoglycan-binding domain-containing protein [Prevotella sp. PINT]|jgi:ABC-type branched-chain amino acid transport systems, periplasmic component|uniref:LysM peptidoglycan-binding domain-containing protein n=1 Tax=Palleniella intestinalis TaxID=2736291 RepID=UPI0015555EF5|nr:LysM peptidoglycan-binding domain-containing protein [Palleniella intestinalis]NPD81121.1 LysM peptidoglycan-binding domain-containing protein [Palleniella intestinalis]
MKHAFYTTIFVLVMFLFGGMSLSAQKILSVHKVKKKETVFGIAKEYGVTIDELRNANPFMREPDFVLKKGMSVNIPEHNPQLSVTQPATTVTKSATKTPVSSSMINVGVMLPLHDINGDGKRMVEYYRGMLLAAKDLRKEGYNLTINAWNVAEEDNIGNTLSATNAAKCNVVFGPLYTSQVRQLADFCMEKNIAMVIPFSITGDDVQTCPQIHQVYQTQADITSRSIDQFMVQFANAHPVFIDCNDVTSKKGAFTFGLRKRLEEKKIAYSITNLNSSPEMFAKAFSGSMRNVVVLNTGRYAETAKAIEKLDILSQATPGMLISMFGYNEWFMYTKTLQNKFHKYDAYVPSVYNLDTASSGVKRLEKEYLDYFKTPMQSAIPRFAITGYDHLMFFVKGYKKYGKEFHGTSSQRNYTPVQTPLIFERVSKGGYKNTAFMLIHF